MNCETPAVELVLLELRKHPSRRIGRDELIERTHCSERVVRAAISELRRQGVPIVGDACGGYGFASGPAEVDGLVRVFERQIHSLQEVVAALKMSDAIWSKHAGPGGTNQAGRGANYE